MDLSQFQSMSPEQQAQTFAQVQTLLRAMEGAREDANDHKVVWFQNAKGVRDVMLFGHWRKFHSRHPEQGVRLLTVEEVVSEQQKVDQAAALRAEKQRVWRLIPLKTREQYGSWDALSLEDMQQLVETAPPVDRMVAMQARIDELQRQLDEATARRGPGRPPKQQPEPAATDL